MGKDVSFSGTPPSKDSSRAVSAFAGIDMQQREEPIEKMKRLTVDVPASLHARVKMQCVQNNESIAEVVRNILEKRFPERYE